ncbi:MAG: alpha amylase C-terminal domain-containing protein [Bacteroidales bacterium]|nr:alpha amylase C-terminal domain-containing protein [Bacteroidales bacterium]
MRHGELYKLFVEWTGGGAERLPAYVTRVVQDPVTKVFSAQVWDPAVPYVWKHPRPEFSEVDAGEEKGAGGSLGLKGRAARGPEAGGPPAQAGGGVSPKGELPARQVSRPAAPFIYECHIGMATEQEKVGTFEEFRRDVLPRVKRLGYNVLQIMALQEHPYYGSFGYQVSNFFALSSRFGTPEEFKALVDEAHGMGIAVIMDIVHSHSVANEAEGLGRLDGRDDLYFYKGQAGWHPAWGSRCFDYGKDEVKYFLLSNCKFWMEEYHIDGFRFDGVTSMLYWDHGLGTDFGDYSLYFGPGVDENAVSYLALANMLIHEINPDAITIAEDVSGMAGLAAPFEAGGVGFDYRMAMGVADHWIKWIKEKSDEQWSPGEMWFELTRKRDDEKTVSYAECHDQALVGDKTLIFRLIDKEMYWGMSLDSQNLLVDRGIALHKMIRLVTAATAGGGYLTFMGNEFGHPEWIDFPREGNGWSYKYARRQWSLADNPKLRYAGLQEFDAAMIKLLKNKDILSEAPSALRCDEEKKILVFLRKNCIFAFNFNPAESYENYAFTAPEGEYVSVLDSDQPCFGGFARLQREEIHATQNHELSLYLPARCALVLERKEKDI